MPRKLDVVGPVAILLVALVCCRSAEGERSVLYDDFETRCAELPCGWTSRGGDGAQAAYRTSIHEGEHGLVLREDGVTVSGPGGGRAAAQLMFSALNARLVARCDRGASLTVTVIVRDAPDAQPIRLDVFEGETAPPAEWNTPTDVILSGTGTLRGGGGLAVQALSLQIRKNGPGECVIDSVRITDVGATGRAGLAC
jgi:hypothetical protein